MKLTSAEHENEVRTSYSLIVRYHVNMFDFIMLVCIKKHPFIRNLHKG